LGCPKKKFTANNFDWGVLGNQQRREGLKARETNTGKRKVDGGVPTIGGVQPSGRGMGVSSVKQEVSKDHGHIRHQGEEV